MRVLLATPSYFPVVGGSETLTRAIAIELNRSGVHTDVITFNMEKKWNPTWSQKVESDGVANVFKMAAINPFAFLPWLPLYFPLGIAVLPRLNFKERFADYDLIHFLGEADLSMPFFSRSIRKPKILQCFGPPHVERQLQKHKNLRRLFVKIFPRLADLYIVFSLDHKRVLTEWGVAQDRIRIWHYGVDTDLFKPDETKRLDNLVLFIGRVEYVKGLHVLLKALDLVKTRTQVAIIGPVSSPEYFHQIQRICVETNQKRFHKIEYLGGMNQHALAPWYQKATVLARPDLVGASGEGMSTMEALACGTPVIGIQNHVIRNGVNGLIVEPNNPGELADALNKILEDKEIRKSYGNAGRKIIEQHFSLKSSVRELTKTYEEAMNGFAR